jgi:uncharacterized protein (DUF924 family)
MRPRIDEVLGFWFDGSADDPSRAAARNEFWFATNPDLDREIRARYFALMERAAASELDNWRVSARGSLALILLLDQFPRNVHRGAARAFATDPAALALCKRGLERGFPSELSPVEQMFFLLPLSHSEQRGDQERCVELFEELHETAPPPWREQLAIAVESARRHRDVIRRFGRFPHRNAALGRPSTADEIAYLEAGGESWGQ